MKKMLLLLSLVILVSPTARALDQDKGPLPRFEPGKTRPYDRESAFQMPRAFTALRSPPGTGSIAPPPEFSWSTGLLLRWEPYWQQVCIDFIAATADAANGSKAFLVVKGSAEEASATNILVAAGVDMSQVEFIHYVTNAIWIRDFGPHFIWHDGTKGVVNSLYFYTRPLDASTPVKIADEWSLPLYDIPLHYEGGNFLSTSNRHAYMSDIILHDNPDYTQQQMVDLFLEYQGVDTLHLFPAFPPIVDLTGHIDMWMCIVDDDKVMIGEYEQITPTYPGWVITENAVTYMQNLGFTVYRLPAWNTGTGGYGGDHYTYTNGLVLNNKAIIPIYGGNYTRHDADAIAAYQAALPGHDVVGVDCESIIWAAGALHCICMHVPAHTDAGPAVKVIAPDGGEKLASGKTRDIRWAAEDDEKVVGVDLYYSDDGGLTFPHVIALDERHDGLYEEWTVPYIRSGDCMIKAVAKDADANTAEDVSDQPFRTDFMGTSVYDFSVGAGVDRWAYGFYTDSWEDDLDHNRRPEKCSIEIHEVEGGAYDKIAHSDATGGLSDPNRYHSPLPGPGKESTMIAVFKIKEHRRLVESLEIRHEGFADGAQHLELYIWDYEAGQWCNGSGLHGYNCFMDNGSNMNDRILEGAITENPAQYIDANGEVTFLIYNDTSNYKTVHDYIRLTVQWSAYRAQPKSM